MMRPDKESSKPLLTIRRRLNDFSGRHGSVYLANGSCCCCCSCLHWVGAAIGAITGSVTAAKAENKSKVPIHPTAKSYVAGGAWTGFAVAVTIVMMSIAFVNSVHDTLGIIVDSVLYGVAIVPSLAMLPVGAGAMIGALVGRSTNECGPVRKGDTPFERSFGLRMAWRIAWQTLLFSTLFAGVGYGVMVLIGLLNQH